MRPALLSIHDACLYIGLGRTKVYDLIAEGRISAHKVGRKTLVPREALDAFVASLSVASVAAPRKRVEG